MKRILVLVFLMLFITNVCLAEANDCNHNELKVVWNEKIKEVVGEEELCCVSIRIGTIYCLKCNSDIGILNEEEEIVEHNNCMTYDYRTACSVCGYIDPSSEIIKLYLGILGIITFIICFALLGITAILDNKKK